MPFANVLRLFCCATGHSAVVQNSHVKALDCAPALIPRCALAVDQTACARVLHQLQCPANAEESWLSRIGMCLAACKLSLHAADVRIVLFGGDSLAAWVISEACGQVQADGWGRMTVVGDLIEQVDSIAIIRDHRHATTQPQQQVLRLLGIPAAAANRPLLHSGAHGSAPDASAFVCRPASEPLQLGPTDLLLLPVRQGSRMTAALLLGLHPDSGHVAVWNGDGGGGGGRGTPSRDVSSSSYPGELRLEPSDLADLIRLANTLAFGIVGSEPGHMRFLSAAADHLGTMPLRHGLSGLLDGLLQALRELLSLRFSMQLQPILALTHGLAGGRAVLFTQRNPGGGGGGAFAAARDALLETQASRALLETHASVQSLSALAAAASSAGPRTTVPPCRMMSGLSVLADRAAADSVTEASPVKAVRVALANTLLSEALRSRGEASSGQGADAATGLASGRNGSNPSKASVAPPGSTELQQQQSRPASGNPRLPPQQQLQQLQQQPEQQGPPAQGGPGHSPDPSLEPQKLSAPSGQPHQQPQQTQQQQQRFSTMILRNASGFVLDEQQPCRDILTIGQLLGANVGSLVLCLESPRAIAAAPAAAAAAPAAARKLAEAADCGAIVTPVSVGDGVGGGNSVRSMKQLWQFRGGVGQGGGSSSGVASCGVPSASSARAPAAAAASQAAAVSPPLLELGEAADAQLYGSPVFALYVVSSDTLPSSILQAIASECKLLLGLLLDSVRSVISGGGQAAAELRALQRQLIDPAGGGGGGGGGGVSVLTVPPTPLHDPSGDRSAAPLSAEPGGKGVAAAALKSVRRLISGARGTKLNHHAHDSDAASGHPADAAIQRSGSTLAETRGSRGPGPATGAAARIARLRTDAAAAFDLLERELRPPQEGALQQWMLASSPELALEAAPGPSQLEVMVSTMRSHLGTAIAEAEAASEARSVLAQDMAALDLQEMIGRGGQGVVYRGLLHGLETAIKVNVCRDGEPLGDEELDAAAVKAGAAADSDGLLSTAEWEEQGARLRKAKRGAMEHALAPTLSHPNIVQVYATFSNVMTVRCTFRGERQPRLRLCPRDSAMLANIPNTGPLNQVICFEYCDYGTLLDAAHRGAFRPAGASSFTAIARPALVPLYMSLLEVALALRYLHARRLVHCDVKPANVLLKGSNRDVRGWTCKLSDFGCTRLMTELPRPEGADNQSSPSPQQAQQQQQAPQPLLGFRMATPLGTVAYMAPEVFLKGQVLTAAVDIYAFGVMMYELLSCRAPYTDVPAADVPRCVVRWHMRPEFHPLAPPEYCALATRCWAGPPTRRPTASQLVGEIEKLLKAAKKSEDMSRQSTTLAVRNGGWPSGTTAAAPPPPSPPPPSPPPPPQPAPGPAPPTAAVGDCVPDAGPPPANLEAALPRLPVTLALSAGAGPGAEAEAGARKSQPTVSPRPSTRLGQAASASPQRNLPEVTAKCGTLSEAL